MVFCLSVNKFIKVNIKPLIYCLISNMNSFLGTTILKNTEVIAEVLQGREAAVEVEAFLRTRGPKNTGKLWQIH